MQEITENIDLKRLRAENGWMSQEQLGEILGVTKQYISSVDK